MQNYDNFLSSQELFEFEVIDLIGKMLVFRNVQKEQYQEITTRANMISTSAFFIAKIASKRYYRLVEDGAISIVNHLKNYDVGETVTFLLKWRRAYICLPGTTSFLTSAIAANIEEFTTSFKILDNLVQMALVVSPKFDISKLAHTFKFASNEIDFNVGKSIILKDICGGYPDQGLVKTDGEISLMQKLIRTQNSILRSPVGI